MTRPRARRVTKAALPLFFLLFVMPRLSAAEASAIEGIRVSKPFFNPTVGQTVQIDFRLRREATLTLLLQRGAQHQWRLRGGCN